MNVVEFKAHGEDLKISVDVSKAIAVGQTENSELTMLILHGAPTPVAIAEPYESVVKRVFGKRQPKLTSQATPETNRKR